MGVELMTTREMIRMFDSEQKRITLKPIRDISDLELSSLEFMAQNASNKLADEGMGYLASSLLASARNLSEDLRAVRQGKLSSGKVRKINSDFLSAYVRLL